MKQRGMPRRCALLVTAAAVLFALPAVAQDAGKGSLHGAPVPADAPVAKVIRIDAKTRSVNVTQDETVRFVVDGAGGEKTFAWQFITRAGAFDLGKVAPPGTLDRVLFAYVAPNPSYGCGNW